MATESIVPSLILAVDATLDAESALLIEGEDASLVLSYGKSLSFDWRTLRLRLDADRRPVVVRGQAALLEDCIKRLMTTRFAVPIYTPAVGQEFEELQGLPISIALPQTEYMIRDCLLADDRVSEVNVDVAQRGPDAISAKIYIRDFNGLLFDLPEVMVRYGQ